MEDAIELNPSYGRFGNADRDSTAQSAAIARLQDYLGTVPGAGRFGFSYVAMVLLGMMVIVGPVDWLVLRKLGRQPWTWVTTSGWIALITLGAVYIGNVVKSGDLHYRSIRLTDQIDGETVGDTALTCIYSPRTTDYHLDNALHAADTAPATPDADRADAQGSAEPPVDRFDPPPGWWRTPMSNDFYSRNSLKNDIAFHQTFDQNAPMKMLINVWNVRFLQAELPSAGGALLRGRLTFAPEGYEASGGDWRLVGQLTNLARSRSRT